MEIKVGWSAEINGQWDKLDIVVEEIDLQRLLADHFLSAHIGDLTNRDTFLLMEGMAEKLICVYQSQRHPQKFPVEEARTKLRELMAQEKSILDRLKALDE